jgi:hypothetical protein
VQYNLLNEFDDRIATDEKPINTDNIKDITNNYIENIYNLMEKSPNLPHLILKNDFAGCLEETYEHVYDKLITEVFEKLSLEILTESHKYKLCKCATYLFTKNTTDVIISPEKDVPDSLINMDLEVDSSGIVIAGFGDLDVFPSIRSYIVIGQFASHINYVPEEYMDFNIDFDNRSEILTFAQNDIAERFVKGIDAKSTIEIRRGFEYAFDPNFGRRFPKDSPQYRLNKLLLALPQNLREEIKENLSILLEDIFDRYGYKLKGEILEIVELLPKQELALLAENLVGVTALARRVSSSEETVGWPVDVALISKGEGFIWFKKKNHCETE